MGKIISSSLEHNIAAVMNVKGATKKMLGDSN
jgi:hypothetical protein